MDFVLAYIYIHAYIVSFLAVAREPNERAQARKLSRASSRTRSSRAEQAKLALYPALGKNSLITKSVLRNFGSPITFVLK